MQKNGLIRKITLILTFTTSHLGKQTIAVHILLNISRSKGNQTMKFGQLIKCNIRKFFLENSYTKCGGETSPRPFSKKTISLDQYCKVLYGLYVLYAKLRAIEIC